MILQRLTSQHPDFQMLATELELDLKIRDGENHALYAELNRIEGDLKTVVAYEQQEPVGCGAFYQYDAGSIEIKRMYVRPSHRNKGIAVAILHELENWSRTLEYTVCLLETGKNQPEAIAFYHKNGYTNIPNFGKYIGSPNSVCFRKFLL